MIQVRMQQEFVIDKSEAKMLEGLVNTLRCLKENLLFCVKKRKTNSITV